MKRIYYATPYDILILFGLFIVVFVMCITYSDSSTIKFLLYVYVGGFVGYYVLIRWLSNKGERHCKYLQYWNIWGNKRHVFISMYNGKCKANEGNEKPGKTEEEKFENEIKHAKNYLAGAKCITCTHAKYCKEIKEVDPECKQQKAYMGTLNRVQRYLGKPCDGKKRQFYRVTFTL